VVLVESYVDESQYRGTCYRACVSISFFESF
jgi:hypothetical protein